MELRSRALPSLHDEKENRQHSTPAGQGFHSSHEGACEKLNRNQQAGNDRG